MWYGDLSDATLQTVSTLSCNEYMRIVGVTGRAGNSNSLDGAIEVFEDFVMKKKVPYLITYLKYEPKKEHRDIDVILRTALFVLKDASTGRLNIGNANLPEFFYLGDVIFMDLCEVNSVAKCARDEVRKYLSFTI